MLQINPHNCSVKILSSRAKVRIRVLLALLVLTPAVAAAKDYKVEVLVFENVGEHRAYESYNYKPIEEISSRADTWLIDPSMLIEEASTIATSEDYRLLSIFSWGQESLPLSQAAAVKIDQMGLNGWIKIYANQLLYANIDLDFNGYRMQEKRRLKLDEKHFFDHPKFGLLVQVSRLEPPEDLPAEELQIDSVGEGSTAEPIRGIR